MKTFYIVEEGGYRQPVKGRVALIHGGVKAFSYIVNGKTIIRDRKTSFMLGEGDTLLQAKQNAIDYIYSAGIDNIKRWIKELKNLQRPKERK